MIFKDHGVQVLDKSNTEVAYEARDPGKGGLYRLPMMSAVSDIRDIEGAEWAQEKALRSQGRHGLQYILTDLRS